MTEQEQQELKEQFRRQDNRFKIVQSVLRYPGLSAEDVLSLSYALEAFIVGDEEVAEPVVEQLYEAIVAADVSEGGQAD